MRTLFKYIEAGILILLTLISLSMVLPFSDMYNFREMINAAKKEGIYYETDNSTQYYFNRLLEVDGVIYDHEENELYILITSRNLFYNSLPSWPTLTIKTSTGVTDSVTAGGGGSSNALRTRGYYHFKDLPEDIEEVVFSKEQYGQSFSFTFDLSGGAHSNE